MNERAVLPPMAADDAPTSFGLLSPCGFGNLGDAATMEATIQNIRRRIPNARIHGITQRPPDTEARHGIPAFPLSRAGLQQAWHKTVPSPGQATSPAPEAKTRPVLLGIGTALRALARLLLPRGWPWAIRTEVQHTVSAHRLLRSIDMVILSGGGQLDDFHGGPWLHPYALAKWAVLAKLTRTRFVVLSTGFGSLDSSVSRFFARLALRLSDYRSYRDPGSKRLMHEAGFRRNDPVFPDLAFSLECSRAVGSAEDATTKEGRICISPMVYWDPERWPVGSASIHSKYLSALTDVAEQLLESDVELVLIASDGPDKHTVKRLRESLIQRLGDSCLHKIHTPPVDTVDDFLHQAVGCQLLIASRLHGVILSHLVGTPAIALSYDRKVDEHMKAIEQMPYCIDLEDFGANQVMEVLQALMDNVETERSSIRRRANELRSLLDSQYDAILGQPRLS